jgi:flagellar basal-body rod protein FlgC
MGSGNGIFSALKISGAGLSAQRTKMNAIASNIANASTTRTDNGKGPYKRKQVVFESTDFLTKLREKKEKNVITMKATSKAHITEDVLKSTVKDPNPGSITATVVEDNSPGRKIYDPSHPDADEEGYVQMPNVNVVTEMMDLMEASRAYEANVTTIQAAKSMAGKALEI